jgi:anti-sigma factor NepR-like protein
MRALPKSRELKSFYTITADDPEGRLARALRICVGNELRNMYGDPLNEPIPPKFADLLHRLDH